MAKGRQWTRSGTPGVLRQRVGQITGPVLALLRIHGEPSAAVVGLTAILVVGHL